MHNTAADKGHSRIHAQIQGESVWSYSPGAVWSYAAPNHPGIGRSSRSVSATVVRLVRQRARAARRANAALMARGVRPAMLAYAPPGVVSACKALPSQLSCSRGFVPTKSGFKDAYGHDLYCCMAAR